MTPLRQEALPGDELLELLDELADGEPHYLPSASAGVLASSGYATWLRAKDFEGGVRIRMGARLRVKITEAGLRERSRRRRSA